MIDGVPVNQPGGAYDFGSALPFELERVEVVRGAASSLYGTDALAGVVSLRDAAGRRRRRARRCAPRAKAAPSTGSAGSARRPAPAGHSTGTWARSASSTDNETPNSRFEQTAAALSAGAEARRAHELRARSCASTTARSGRPGPTAFGPPDLDASFEREDLVLSATLRRVQARVSQQLSLGYSSTDQLSLDPADSGCYTPEWQGQPGCLPDVRLPEPQRLPEPDGPARRRVPGGPVARGTAPADGGGRARARDGRARQPRRGAAAAGAHQRRRLRAGPRARSAAART